MKETSKCKDLRTSRGDFAKYLVGHGIDIGAGDDPLVVEKGSVLAWDIPDGDAQKMEGVADNSFDFVYSSHCLEHMRDVPEALRNWVRILKPGGHLYVVVPDYILYEKMTWPPMFNTDHKQSFSFLVTRSMTRRENHYHLEQDFLPLLQKNELKVLDARLEDTGFNYNAGMYDQTFYTALSQLCIVAQKIRS